MFDEIHITIKPWYQHTRYDEYTITIYINGTTYSVSVVATSDAFKSVFEQVMEKATAQLKETMLKREHR